MEWQDVMPLAKKLIGRRRDYEDLLQESWFIFERCRRYYDESRGAKFSSYFARSVRHMLYHRKKPMATGPVVEGSYTDNIDIDKQEDIERLRLFISTLTGTRKQIVDAYLKGVPARVTYVKLGIGKTRYHQLLNEVKNAMRVSFLMSHV